jgi:hypothetical protein
VLSNPIELAIAIVVVTAIRPPNPAVKLKKVTIRSTSPSNRLLKKNRTE